MENNKDNSTEEKLSYNKKFKYGGLKDVKFSIKNNKELTREEFFFFVNEFEASIGKPVCLSEVDT